MIRPIVTIKKIKKNIFINNLFNLFFKADVKTGIFFLLSIDDTHKDNLTLFKSLLSNINIIQKYKLNKLNKLNNKVLNLFNNNYFFKNLNYILYITFDNMQNIDLNLIILYFLNKVNNLKNIEFCYFFYYNNYYNKNLMSISYFLEIYKNNLRKLKINIIKIIYNNSIFNFLKLLKVKNNFLSLK